MAYTPFLTKAAGAIDRGLQKRYENDITKRAYMGDAEAFSQLSSINPQAAASITREKKAKEQESIRAANRKQDIEFRDQEYAAEQTQKAEKANIDSEDRQIKAIEANREYATKTMEESVNFNNYEDAKAFVAQRVNENKELSVYADGLELTKEVWEQNKIRFGGKKPFAGKGMEAQVSNMLVKGVNNEEYRGTPEYSRAYQLASEAKIIKTPTGDILLEPEIPIMFKAPGEKDVTEKEQIKEILEKSKKDAEKVKYIPGTRKPEKFTEGEKLSAGFYARMINSRKNIDKLGDFDPSDTKEVAMGVTNVTASENMQLYRQAADDWIRAKLRKESGAVIGDDEMAKEYQTYFPRLGDSIAVIAQKKDARKIAVDAMKANAGAFIKDEEKKTTEAESELALPQGVTEDQMKYTMDKYKMTRQQVIDKLKGG